MVGSSSDPMHRLFNFGAVGTLSDARLHDRFVARRDEAAEAAFEELVIRHGPMVARICRSVLHNAHDAEDAFQAVFLVLADRARSIRGSGSVASWLFRVAHRVANRSKRSAARRNALNQLVAERISESYLPAEHDADWEILHAEIDGLPERLRAPVVLCYLQGLTCAAAAHQLGLSETAVRGRLARARDRLRQRLTRRGVTVPGGLLVAGAAGHSQVPIPMTLIHSTSRIALGSLAAQTAAILARGVLNSMLLHQLRVATVLLCLASGGGYWAWHALGSVTDGNVQPSFGPAAAGARASSQPPRTDRYGDPLPPGAAMRLGTVRFRRASPLKHIAYSSDGQLVVTEDEQGILVVRGARDGKMLRQIDFRSEGVIDFGLSPDQQSIATVGFRLEPKRNAVANHLTFTEVATGRTVRRGEWDDQDNVENVAYLPDGKTVATVNLKGVFRLWDVATAKLRHEQRLGEGRSRDAIAFSRDSTSRMLAIAWGQTIDLWDVSQIRRTRRIALDGAYRPACLAFSPDGMTLAAGMGSVGVETRLWRVGDGNLLRRFKSRKNPHVSFIAFSPDGKVLAAIGSGGPLVFFDTATGQERDLLPGNPLVDGPLAFSPDGKDLATTGDRQTLHFWDLVTGQDRLGTPEEHQGAVLALAFSNDGKTLLSGSRDRTARVWDLPTGRSTQMLPHGGWVEPLSVSKDGALLATASSYPEWGTIRVWNLKTGEKLHAWTVERTSLRGVTLSEDGSSAIAAFGDGSLRRWDISTGKDHPIAQPKTENLPAGIPAPGKSGIARAVFSRDGRALALIGGDCVQLIDVASGERHFKSAAVRSACAFALDGASLLVVGKMTRRGIQAGSWGGSRPVASTIAWLDSRTGHVRREIEVPESYVMSLAFSPDGQAIAIGTLLTKPARGIIRIFRLHDKKEIRTIESPCPWIEALAFTPKGQRIVAGLSDTSIVIWDVRPMEDQRRRSKAE
jgi:RNA polymerase sigma factor (sigma-70 family)